MEHKIITEYKSWKQDNPDTDYQYDEIHEFLGQMSRGEAYDFMEHVLKLSVAANELWESLQEVVRISDRKHVAWDKAKAAIKKATEIIPQI